MDISQWLLCFKTVRSTLSSLQLVILVKSTRNYVKSSSFAKSRPKASITFYEVMKNPHKLFHRLVTLGQNSSIHPKIHIFKISLFTKFTFSKSHFFTKFTFWKSQFWQNWQFQSLIFHKIHIFKISLFTKFTIILDNFWIKVGFCPSVSKHTHKFLDLSLWLIQLTSHCLQKQS